jgi:hypothetical protein
MEALMEPKKDLVAELDLAGLFESRGKAAEKQKKANERLAYVKFNHVVSLLVGGIATGLSALWLAHVLPLDEPFAMLLLVLSIAAALGMLLAAFLPSETVWQHKEEASAATKQVKTIDDKIAFCNLVLDEAKRVKIKKYAEAWVEKELK